MSIILIIFNCFFFKSCLRISSAGNHSKIIRIRHFKPRKTIIFFYQYIDQIKVLKGTGANRELQSSHGGSLEIKLTVPLNYQFWNLVH